MLSLQTRHATTSSSLQPDTLAAVQNLSDGSTARRLRWWMAFTLYLAAGMYLMYPLNLLAGDAVSRVANAYYVLFSSQPHLGAIGFIWNPLPSLLALPLVVLHPWLPDVVSKGLAGTVVSAAFGAFGVNGLYDALGQLGLGSRWRWLAVGVYAFNPLVVLYGANGMTDLMLATCVIGATSGVLSYTSHLKLKPLVGAAIWLVIGFGVRYEAIPLGFGLAAGLAASLWGRVSLRQIEGAVVLLLAPLAWSAGIWIYFNAIIMKNPLYFLNSDYGNLAQIATGAYFSHPLAAARHSLVGTLSYLGHFTLLFWPLDLGVAVAAYYLFGRRRDPRAPVLLGALVGSEALEAAFLYLGHLGQWDRYFINYLPMGVLLASFAWVKLSSAKRQWARWGIGILFPLILLSGDVGTVITLNSRGWGYDDGLRLSYAFSALRGQHPPTPPAGLDLYEGLQPLVSYLDAHPHLHVLADSFIDFPVLILAHNLNQFVITSDYDFHSILDNPRGRVDAILVPRPAGVATLDAVNRTWPGLWAGKVPWATLIRSFPGGNEYRLYRVGPNAP
ncbi:MAG: glycosyltransferase family 39 protein [Firmicutes bacterium]|nr:glycosyltransferase family 39 protein [Bacillota bacterium]